MNRGLVLKGGMAPQLVGAIKETRQEQSLATGSNVRVGIRCVKRKVVELPCATGEISLSINRFNIA